MADPDTFRTVALELREWGSGPVGTAKARVDLLGLRRRLFCGLGPVFLAMIGALVLLPVPLMHLAGIPLLAIGLYFGFRNARAREVFRSASGTCPSCNNTTDLFVGFGRPPFKLPVKTSCSSCGRNLTLERVSGTTEDQ
jgi:hypothetical protein